jgi:hypothetical protein
VAALLVVFGHVLKANCLVREWTERALVRAAKAHAPEIQITSFGRSSIFLTCRIFLEILGILAVLYIRFGAGNAALGAQNRPKPCPQWRGLSRIIYFAADLLIEMAVVIVRSFLRRWAEPINAKPRAASPDRG